MWEGGRGFAKGEFCYVSAERFCCEIMMNQYFFSENEVLIIINLRFNETTCNIKNR